MGTRTSYSKRRYTEWRTWAIAYLGGKCVGCKTVTKLEIHHRDPTQKKFNPTSCWDSRSKVIVELMKCELRCAACHLKAHGRVVRHGTTTGYSRGCRCTECVLAQREYNQKWYRNNDERLREYHRTRYHNDLERRRVYNRDYTRRLRSAQT